MIKESEMDMKELMRSLGFTEYEAKAYQALIREPAQTGYAVAKNSGVPRSKIYEVLDGLVTRGDVITSSGNPPLYRALPVSEMITRRRRESDENLKKAEQELMKLQVRTDDYDNIWNIRGRDAILQKLAECIRNSVHRIMLEIWSEDYSLVAGELSRAAERGVSVILVSYGEIEAEYARVYQHDMSDEVTEEYGGRWVVFSADDRQVLAGTVSLNDENRAAWTMHPGLVMPITEVIIHDLYIAEILKEHRAILEKSFGRDLIDLRRKFITDPAGTKHYIPENL